MIKTYLIPILISVVSFLLILILAYDPVAHGTSVDEQAPPEDRIRLSETMMKNIQTEEVRLKPAETEIAFSGKIEYDPDRFTQVFSPVSGKVMKIIAEFGEQISEGSPILAIESAEISAAYADFSRCRSEVALSQERFELARERYQASLISKRALQQAIDETLRTESELNQARRRLHALNVSERALHPHLAAPPFLYLRSPCSGILIEKKAAVGERAGSSTPLFTLADLSTVAVRGALSEKDLPAIQPGREIMLSVETYPSRRFLGKIKEVGDQIDPAGRTVQIRGTVGNAGWELRPEMTARIWIEESDRKERISIPRTALFTEGGEHFVFLVLPGPAFRRSRVILGGTENGRSGTGSEVEVVAGLTPGNRIVTDGVLILRSISPSPPPP